jgi:hypothetical protein
MTLSSADVYDAHLGTPGAIPVGMSAVFSEGFQQIFDIAAKLEPDCDNDGLGDETQDPDPSGVCPVVTPGGGQTGSNGSNGQTTQKKCKKKKKKHKRSAESAKKHKKKGCKKKKKKRH